MDSSRVALEAALGSVRSIAKEVNEKVRQAEGRARLLACAHALSHPELIAPQRILLHEADVEAQKLSARGTLGQRQRCRVWLTSDAVLVGREHALLAAARVGIPLGKGGTSFALVQQSSLSRSTLANAEASGQESLLLTAKESETVVSLLRFKSPEQAEEFLLAFGAAQATDATARGPIEKMKQERTRTALAELEQRKAGGISVHSRRAGGDASLARGATAATPEGFRPALDVGPAKGTKVVQFIKSTSSDCGARSRHTRTPSDSPVDEGASSLASSDSPAEISDCLNTPSHNTPSVLRVHIGRMLGASSPTLLTWRAFSPGRPSLGLRKLQLETPEVPEIPGGDIVSPI